jgi:CTP synthase (UTP-ammonia lyase)
MIAPREKVENYAKISSVSYDGLVESFELNNKKFVIGIKWHPELMIEDEVENGYYKIVEVIPPKISNISNMIGNYASDTTINYEVVNEEGHELTHYFSIDNGDNWQVIKPTKNGDNYSFKHIFNEVKTHYCRIKVIDAINSSATSNLFTVTVNHSMPNINILGHNNLDFRFRVTCITSEISKIEIYVNDVLKETITENLDFTQVYSIDKSLLTNSKNYVQIKLTTYH